MYTPPFTLSDEAVNNVSEISKILGKYSSPSKKTIDLKSRKENLIKSIYGSLAIEGNRLTKEMVTDVIKGKHVLAPRKDIQEVKNALEVYENYKTFDPFKEKDLLSAHGIMMKALVDNAGNYRKEAVGVFSKKGMHHIAPPADRVPLLMHDLFSWLKKSKTNLLIRSSVFHYEFEFIHPFLDGNGRMGRLWQSLILGKIHPVFECMPIENVIYANQKAYYQAISKSSLNGESGPFIDFMLDKILITLKNELIKPKNVGINVGINEREFLKIIQGNPKITTNEIAEKLEITRRQVDRLIAKLKEMNLIYREGSNKNGSWKIVEKK